MIDVTRIDHIGIAVRDLEPQIEFLERVFEFRYRGRFVERGYIGAELEAPGRSGIVWEMLAPDGPDSFLHRFLDGVHGPGLHHLSMQVRDMDAALVAMDALDIQAWGYEQRSGMPRGEVSLEPGLETPLEGRVATDAEGQPTDPGNREPGAEDQPDTVAYVHPRSGGAGFLFQLHAGAPWYLPEPFVTTERTRSASPRSTRSATRTTAGSNWASGTSGCSAFGRCTSRRRRSPMRASARTSWKPRAPSSESK